MTRWLLLPLVLLAAPVHAGYVGTTPCDAPVRKFLQVKALDKCEVVRWNVWHLSPVGPEAGPQALDIEAEIGVEGGKFRKIKRHGEWRISRGLPARPNARVVDMRIGDNRLGLWLIDQRMAYLLDEDRALLAGNSGYSYALALALSSNRQRTPANAPDLDYPLTPPSSGDDVLGIYEGRTPCAMGQVLGVAVPRGCTKLKWRLTLYQLEPNGAPTTYKLEGALFPQDARTGRVMLVQSNAWEEEALGFELTAGEGEQPVYLLVGDRNVLFFVDKLGKLGQGASEFNYVLSRVGPL